MVPLNDDVSNRTILERAIAAWNRGDLAEYLQLYSDDIVIHGYEGLEPGIANVRRFYEAWWTAFPGSQLAIEDTVAAGGRVACRARLSGPHRGSFQGIPPSGRPISVSAFTILRFSNGMCVERWSLVDSLGLLTQIGALGADQPPLAAERDDASERLFHIAFASTWANSADPYVPAGFETEGFVHCSTQSQVIDVANRLFRGRSDLVILTIAVERIDAPIRYENLTGGSELFPHIYSPIPRESVVAVVPLTPRSDGSFEPPG
jgi:steroid delta-isomerase-like uncharacterized protein